MCCCFSCIKCGEHMSQPDKEGQPLLWKCGSSVCGWEFSTKVNPYAGQRKESFSQEEFLQELHEVAFAVGKAL